MITLSDQLYVTLPLPDDTRLTNLVLNGSTVTVESKNAYLSRVDFNSRYLGMEVDFLEPLGIYGVNDFLTKINSNLIVTTKYGFLRGTANEFFEPVPCCNSGGGDGGGGETPGEYPEDPNACCFDPTADYELTGDWTFRGNNHYYGTNIHRGNEMFKTILMTSDEGVNNWYLGLDANNDLEIINNTNETKFIFTKEGFWTNACIQAPGVFVEGETGFLKADCTVDSNIYLTEEIDPVFTAWDKTTGITIYVDQIIDPENLPGGGGGSTCILTEQDCLNIKAIPDFFANFDCNGLEHNNLAGLQGGDPLAEPPEFYHLTLAAYDFLMDIIENGSGVLTLHSELADILPTHYTHDQINTHIDDTTIHFTIEDLITNEADPVFTAERDLLTENYITMKGATTLVDSPIFMNYTNSDRTTVVIPGAIATGDNSSVFIGNNAGMSLGIAVTDTFNTFVGESAGSNLISGSGNLFLGALAGTLLFDEMSSLEYASGSLYIGNLTLAGADSVNNETVIGNNAMGHGSNTITIGNSSVTDNYFYGKIIAPLGFEVVPNTYMKNDIAGNLIFKDPIVNRDVTLTELLSGADYQWWNISANKMGMTQVTSKKVVSFNGSDNISVVLTNPSSIDLAFDLKPTGVTAGEYNNPTIVVDDKGRILAIAPNTSGCSQLVADMQTQHGSIDFDLDTYSGAIVTLDGNLTINFTNMMEGDTGHIEVTHTGAQVLNFSCPDATIKISNNCKAAGTNTVVLTPYAAIDVIAYWVAKTNLHIAVIYDMK